MVNRAVALKDVFKQRLPVKVLQIDCNVPCKVVAHSSIKPSGATWQGKLTMSTHHCIDCLCKAAGSASLLLSTGVRSSMQMAVLSYLSHAYLFVLML
jgi:hypothetical protein